MCAIITPFWAKGRVHKRQEPSGGRVVKNTTRVCCGSKLDLDVLPYINFFQGPGCQASRRGPQTPKGLTAVVARDLSSKNVCSSRGCHKSETGTACSKETVHLQTSCQQPACSYYANMTATIMNEWMCFQAVKCQSKTVLFQLQSHHLIYLLFVMSKSASVNVLCIFLTFFHRFLEVFYWYIYVFS